jgi:hypothetical protein
MRTRCQFTLNKSFPSYNEHDRRHLVTPQRLNQAIHKATSLFAAKRPEYTRVFRNYASKHLHCKRQAVKFCPLSESQARIRKAQLYDSQHFGETDGLQIWISRKPMSFAELVGTLIHEELHCFCRARGRYLGAESDHHCMKTLGDV